MQDLVNERAEVAGRLEELNLEPVWAEDLTPTGQESWDRIKAAIEGCDIFVLILGESYGWIPREGPMAEHDKSVTELEFDHARALGIPVLVFVKRLGEHAPRGTDDARRRDAFRRTVEDWNGGFFRSQFELARDLADQVGRAVADLITDRFRAAQLADRRTAKSTLARSGMPSPATPDLPPALIEATAAGRTILLLGAGASLEAGMPSAAMFIQAMATEIRHLDPDYDPGLSGTAFNAVATDFQSLRGERSLRKLAGRIVEPGFAVPTEAHRIAGRLFDTILTTNYDLLLERSLVGSERDFTVIDREADPSDLSAPQKLIKLHGSLADPQSLVLTEWQLANLETDRPVLWGALVELLGTRPLLSVGSSLRDPSLIRLLEESLPGIGGWAVLGGRRDAEQQRLRRWGLEIVPGDSNGVLIELDRQVSRLRR
jgi:hypothetical protein